MTIYILQATGGGPIKIGHAAIPSARRAQISSFFPYGVDLLCTFEGGRIGETFLHRCFDPIRISAEWFNSTPEIWRFILSVIDNGRPEFLPSEVSWNSKQVEAMACHLFGDLTSAKDALGYSRKSPIAQVFSVSSKFSYSVQGRLQFRKALASGELPECIAKLHRTPADTPANSRETA